MSVHTTPPPATTSHRAATALLQRWPTWLGVLWAAVAVWDLETGVEYAVVLPLAGAGYLLLAALDRPRLTWPLLGVLLVVVVATRLADVDPVPVLAAVAAAALVLGAVRGTLRRSALHLLQAPVAMVAIGVAVTALGMSPDVGGRVIALGLIGHAVWDAVLWRADRVVQRSFVEWCGVYDVLVGGAILVLA
jgi:hypothetical protein